MNVQVYDGGLTGDKPDNVPNAVEMICKHSPDHEPRLYYAKDLIHNNMTLFNAIIVTQFKETGRDTILNLDDAADSLLRWCKLADKVGQFKEDK